MSHELIRVTAVWGCSGLNQLPPESARVLLSLLLSPSKMNLELLMGRGAASPHLKPLSGLANLLVCVSPQTLPPQRHEPVDKIDNIYGS